MNTKHIESGFALMGARVKVREIASRWTQGDRSWISPQDYSLDIQRDGKGEFFELRVPTHLSDALDINVIQSEPKQRHLLLFVRKPGDRPQLDRFLCGHDEREWFVAAVPGGASSVRQAMDSLQPAPVRQALASHKVSTNKRYSRKNKAFRRQGEWFFIPEPAMVVDPKLVLLLGSVAVKKMLGARSVEDVRGKIIERDGRKYLASFHPAVRFYREDLAQKIKLEFALLMKELKKL